MRVILDTVPDTICLDALKPGDAFMFPGQAKAYMITNCRGNYVVGQVEIVDLSDGSTCLQNREQYVVKVDAEVKVKKDFRSEIVQHDDLRHV